MSRSGHNPRYDSGVRALMAKRDEVNCLRFAREIAVSMAQRFYPEPPQFTPYDTLSGLLSQIDSMTAGLQREVKPETLASHYLWQMVCDHDAKTDVAICSCGQWQSAPMPSVGDAALAWADHALGESCHAPE